ncbi:MAG: hypothetical protein V4805_09085 [Pseudomonadota bacterium]
MIRNVMVRITASTANCGAHGAPYARFVYLLAVYRTVLHPCHKNIKGGYWQKYRLTRTFLLAQIKYRRQYIYWKDVIHNCREGKPTALAAIWSDAITP